MNQDEEDDDEEDEDEDEDDEEEDPTLLEMLVESLLPLPTPPAGAAPSSFAFASASASASLWLAILCPLAVAGLYGVLLLRLLWRVGAYALDVHGRHAGCFFWLRLFDASSASTFSLPRLLSSPSSPLQTAASSASSSTTPSSAPLSSTVSLFSSLFLYGRDGDSQAATDWVRDRTYASSAPRIVDAALTFRCGGTQSSREERTISRGLVALALLHFAPFLQMDPSRRRFRDSFRLYFFDALFSFPSAFIHSCFHSCMHSYIHSCFLFFSSTFFHFRRTRGGRYGAPVELPVQPHLISTLGKFLSGAAKRRLEAPSFGLLQWWKYFGVRSKWSQVSKQNTGNHERKLRLTFRIVHKGLKLPCQMDG